jgi:hypothetical protein
MPTSLDITIGKRSARMSPGFPHAVVAQRYARTAADLSVQVVDDFEAASVLLALDESAHKINAYVRNSA